MKKLVRIIKDVQSYKKGMTYRLHGSFANNLIRLKKAEEVKEEKKVIETKEEKFLGSDISTKNLAMVVGSYTIKELQEIINKDIRVTAKKIATEELKKRG